MRTISVSLILILLATALAACGTTPAPETVVQTVEVEKTVVETVEVEKEVVVTVEVDRASEAVIEFWTTDNEEERVDVYEEVAARYMAEHPEVEIRIVPIEEAGVSQRMATALAANRPPDIIRMGVERVAAFAADGILDEEAAQAVVGAGLDGGHGAIIVTAGQAAHCGLLQPGRGRQLPGKR